MTYGIYDKAFSGSLFWAGGDTKKLRLDEINAIRDGGVVGDTSAYDIVEKFFKDAGFLQNRLASRLHEVFAAALISEVGDDPTAYMNNQYDHVARKQGMRALGVPVGEEIVPEFGGEQTPHEQVPSPDYDNQTVNGLRVELGDRGLSTSGNKSELVERLREDDSKRVEAQSNEQ